MTAVALDPGTAAPITGAGRRILRIARLHFANPWTTIILPWLIVGAILVLNFAIWLIVLVNAAPEDRADVREGLQWSGSSMWIFVYMMVVAIQAMNLTFPLALGYGATRRDFYLGTVLAFVSLSAMYALGLTLLSVIEVATGGWGVGGVMFTSIYFGGELAWYLRLALYFFAMLFFFFTGSAFGAVYVRWRVNGVIGLVAIIAVLLVGAVALFTFTASWGSVGEFFSRAQALGTVSALLVPAAISAVAGYFVLRGATPRS